MVRVRTGEDHRFDFNRAVRRLFCPFQCAYIDSIGLAHAPLGIVTLLKERSAAGEIREDEVDGIVKTYGALIRERDLMKGVPTASDPFNFKPQNPRSDGSGNTPLSLAKGFRYSALGFGEFFGFVEDPDGPLSSLSWRRLWRSVNGSRSREADDSS
ncbi:hypothetical protein C8T65DRAFT_827449 [Cerioporus squamosus]|nr:hypothetical protein C8T65DRAFT_827449 [Cerioporus squamosus]